MADNERDISESLFYKGYEYNEICEILKTQHSINLNLGQLKRKLKHYNLRRNKVEFDDQSLRSGILEILDAPVSIPSSPRNLTTTLLFTGLRFLSRCHSWTMRLIGILRLVVKNICSV